MIWIRGTEADRDAVADFVRRSDRFESVRTGSRTIAAFGEKATVYVVVGVGLDEVRKDDELLDLSRIELSGMDVRGDLPEEGKK